VLFEGLKDALYGAPGEWTLHRCTGCAAAYQDPRLTPACIGSAYRRYYTHQAGPELPADPGATGRAAELKVRLRNGYLVWRYGLPLVPAWKSLGRLVLCFPRHRIAFDTSVRHLPLPHSGARLLDVGCGGGDFLAHARSLGWAVTGLEVDAAAAKTARGRRIDVLDVPLADARLPDGAFDAVTMNHVLEHLHDPVGTLAEVRRILKPGGRLWLATPNLDSPLCRALGPSWRGLEPPRHLVLFGKEALRRAILAAGFTDLTWANAYPLTRWMLDASPASAAARAAVAGRPFRLKLLEIGTMFSQRWSEQLVAMARRPEGRQ
jgi:2-polyprenyl-3-methyl-5-hydroxy-6-metoxy-1,4-benzoquinol methylase